MSTYSLANSLEWLNDNLHRNYPLVDDMVTESTTPGVVLPTSFLVDLQLIVPFVEGIDAARFFISSVVRSASSLQVTIGYMISDPEQSDAREGFDCAISSAIPIDLEFIGEMDAAHMIKLSAITNEVPQITGSYTYGIPDAYSALRNIRGILYIGSCSDMKGIGALKFNYEHAAIMQSCVYVEDKESTVQSLRILDDKGNEGIFTDDVTIKLDDNLTATVNEDHTVVSISLDTSAIRTAVNAALDEAIGNAIKTINGVSPDDQGDFQIKGLDCTLIGSEQDSTGITISNPCAKPCCDQNGADSAEITKALTDLTSAKDILNNYYTDLATKVNLMQARLSALIASRR